MNQSHRYRLLASVVCAAALVFCQLGCRSSRSGEGPGDLTVFTEREPSSGGRESLVVVVHGCLQSAEAMIQGAGFQELQVEFGYQAIYPQVQAGKHSLDCWSWYLPENQKRESGELKEIMDFVDAHIQQSGLQNPKIFIVGMSSGAVTVAGLISCYPERFDGALIHSGPGYGTATNAAEAQRVLRDGPPPNLEGRPCNPRDFQKPVLIVQGDADAVVNPKHVEQHILDFSGGGPPQLLAEGFANEFGFRDVAFSVSGKVRLRVISVHGLGHAWSGSLAAKDKSISFFDFHGPDVTRIAIESWGLR